MMFYSHWTWEDGPQARSWDAHITRALMRTDPLGDDRKIQRQVLGNVPNLPVTFPARLWSSDDGISTYKPVGCSSQRFS